MKEKIERLITELRMLCKIAWYEPQAAYSCFITGFDKHIPTYFMRTIPKISNQIKQLGKVVRTEFVPAISVGILIVQTLKENCCHCLLNLEDLAFQFSQK